MTRRLAPALLGLTLGACAAAPPRPADTTEVAFDERRTSRDEHAELLSLESSVAARLEATDCDGACGAVARICELSESICGIASRHRGDDELLERCTDGRSRCRAAVDRTRASPCDCATPTP